MFNAFEEGGAVREAWTTQTGGYDRGRWPPEMSAYRTLSPHTLDEVETKTAERNIVVAKVGGCTGLSVGILLPGIRADVVYEDGGWLTDQLVVRGAPERAGRATRFAKPGDSGAVAWAPMTSDGAVESQLVGSVIGGRKEDEWECYMALMQRSLDALEVDVLIADDCRA